MRASSGVLGDVAYDLQAARRYEQLVAPRFTPVANALVNQADITTGDSVIEFAAGTGSLTRRLVERLNPPARLFVTDRSSAMLEVAADVTGRSGQTTYRVIDFNSGLPLDDETFDLAFCQFGYLHLSATGLRECARILRPRGSLHIAFWGCDYLELSVLSEARRANGLPPIEPTQPADVEAHLGNAGLQLSAVTDLEFPAHFADAQTYVAYRRALGLSEDPIDRERDVAVLTVAAELLERRFGHGEPVCFQWQATLVRASLPFR